jgi:hypothetical protein
MYQLSQWTLLSHGRGVGICGLVAGSGNCGDKLPLLARPHAANTSAAETSCQRSHPSVGTIRGTTWLSLVKFIEISPSLPGSFLFMFERQCCGVNRLRLEGPSSLGVVVELVGMEPMMDVDNNPVAAPGRSSSVIATAWWELRSSE